MLGVCYYPEHWPETRWQVDAKMMAELGLTYVRIGEFCWSRLEPERDRFDWDWLDRAIGVLGDAGLQVILGTPTATPPKWLIDARPDILAYDHHGRPRRFGSRRHTCFSSPAWLEETRRIVELVAKRYGPHPAIVGWQLDNEFGCHDTVRSYAPHCEPAFQRWLKRRYGDITALNQAWGTVFWSQEYAHFGQVSLPHLTVTEANPAHRLDYDRFSSDQVLAYSAMQAEIVRAHAPGRFIAHNVMGFFDQFDHFALADQLDVCGWDSYPLGFTSQNTSLSESEKRRFARTGHPDIAALHHDLYRSAAENGAAHGRLWVLEQQPGPVNWAPYNPVPAPGMVRLWTWEALAHGAHAVCYFRWRQMPRAQEQMHAAVLRPDAEPAQAWDEVTQVRRELAELDRAVPDWRSAGPADASANADADATDANADSDSDSNANADSNAKRPQAPPTPVAIVFDYQAAWMLAIQPHGVGPSYFDLIRRCYTGLRRLGVNIDLVRPGGALGGYKLVVAPTLPTITDATWKALSDTDADVVVGARTGSRDPGFGIPDNLPPGPLQAALPMRITAVDSVRADEPGEVYWPLTGRRYPAGTWREHIASTLAPQAYFDRAGPSPSPGAGPAAVLAHGRFHYLGFWPDEAFWMDYLESVLSGRGVKTTRLPEALRLRRRGRLTFALNTGAAPMPAPAPANARFVLGTNLIAPHDIAAWLD